MRISPRARLIVGLGCLLLFAGCSGGSAGTAVSGSVSFQGQDLDHGLLNFFRDGTVVAGCPIAADGTYTCELPAGEYTVTVNSPLQPPAGWKDGDPPPQGGLQVAPKYGLPKTSPLTISVGAAGPEVHDFSLK